MRKREFLWLLNRRLSGLPKQEIEERLNFYSEMIDDRKEEGLTEEDAVSAVGSVDDIVAQIKGEEHQKDATDNIVSHRKRLTSWDIVLLIVGSPVWFPLLVAALAVIVAGYAVIWSLILILWAIEAPFYIFAFISKYLLVFCKKATICAVMFTKNGFSRIFNGGKKHQ